MTTWPPSTDSTRPLTLCELRLNPRRPAFMQALGLLPPYSLTDVKKAYRDKAKRIHPDAGGDPEKFKALRCAYERALEYAKFRDSRREWLGNHIERYATRELVREHVQHLGGHCRLSPMRDVLDDFGPDFAEVVRTLIAIKLSGPHITDASLGWTETAGSVSTEVRTLIIENADVSTRGLKRLAVFGSLRALDLRGTKLSPDGLAVLDRFPGLEWLHLGQTGVRYWTRRRFKRTCPGIKVVTSPSVKPPADSHWDEFLSVMRRTGSQ